MELAGVVGSQAGEISAKLTAVSIGSIDTGMNRIARKGPTGKVPGFKTTVENKIRSRGTDIVSFSGRSAQEKRG